MPLHQSQDEQARAGSHRRGALALALSFAALLAGACGLAGYVWLSPSPLWFGSHALVGPGYRPPFFAGSYAYIIDEPLGAISVNRRDLLLSRSSAPGATDVAEVLWQWGSVRWVRILKTR